MDPLRGVVDPHSATRKEPGRTLPPPPSFPDFSDAIPSRESGDFLPSFGSDFTEFFASRWGGRGAAGGSAVASGGGHRFGPLRARRRLGQTTGGAEASGGRRRRRGADAGATVRRGLLSFSFFLFVEPLGRVPHRLSQVASLFFVLTLSLFNDLQMCSSSLFLLILLLSLSLSLSVCVCVCVLVWDTPGHLLILRTRFGTPK